MKIDVIEADEALGIAKQALDTARSWINHPHLDAAREHSTGGAAFEPLLEEIASALKRVFAIRSFLRALPDHERSDV